MLLALDCLSAPEMLLAYYSMPSDTVIYPAVIHVLAMIAALLFPPTMIDIATV